MMNFLNILEILDFMFVTQGNLDNSMNSGRSPHAKPAAKRNSSAEKLIPETFPRKRKQLLRKKVSQGKCFWGGQVSVINPTTNPDFPEITVILDFQGD